MSRKETPKPLFALKHDFYASLDHTLQQVINLVHAAELAVQHGGMKPAMSEALTKQIEATKTALMME